MQSAKRLLVDLAPASLFPSCPRFAAGLIAVLLSCLSAAAVQTVTNTNDAGPGSLRQAVAGAAAGETVQFDASFTGSATQRSIGLTSPLVMTRDVYLAGPGPGKLKLVAAVGQRHISVQLNKRVRISNLMLEGPAGAAAVGGGVQNQGFLWMAGSVLRHCRVQAPESGGAISSVMQLELISCFFEGNEAMGETALGGAVVDSSGVAWSASGGLRISGCTFQGNKAGRTGGAISVSFSGAPVMENSTFFDNWAGRTGGAMALNGGATLTHCTITRNTAVGTGYYGFGAGGVHSAGSGGATLTMRHTILSGNTGPSGDVHGDFSATTAWNVVGSGRASDIALPLALTDGASGNKVGISDPRLQLSPNLGTILTPFFLPLADSPAFNAGITPGSPDLGLDQIGIARPQGLRADIGAMEAAAQFTVTLPEGVFLQPYASPAITPSFGAAPFSFGVLEPLPAGLGLNAATGRLYGTAAAFGTFPLTFTCLTPSQGVAYATATLVIPPPPPLMVTTGDDNGSVASPLAGSLRAALKAAESVAGTRIAFVPGLTEVGLRSPQCQVSQSVEIDGGASGVMIYHIASAVDDRMLIVTGSGSLSVKNLHFTGGRHPSQAGVIQVNGSITADSCTFSENTCPQAAAVEVDGPRTSTFTNCTFANNYGGEAITFSYSTGQHLMRNCTVVNQRTGTGSIGAGITAGAWYEVQPSVLTLKNCLVINNEGGSMVGILGEGSTNNVVSKLRPGGLLVTQLSPLVGGQGGLFGFVDGVNGNVVLPYGTGPDPLLDPLGNYGGPVPTVALPVGSVALNAGGADGAPATDARGQVRPSLGGIDVGAFESAAGLTNTPPALTQGVAMPPFQLTAAGEAPHSFTILSGSLPAGVSLSGSGVLSGSPTTVGSSTAQLRIISATGVMAWDSLTVSVLPRREVTNANDTGAGSLRDILAALLPGETVSFEPTFFATARIITLATPLPLGRSLTLTGPGAALLTLRSLTGRLFTYTGSPSDHDVTLADLTLAEFSGTTSPGGAVLNTTGDVTLLRCIVRTMSLPSTLQGGVFRLTGGSLTLTDCQISGISGAARGSLAWVKNGAVSLTRCDITNVTCTQKGSVIYQENGALTVTDCFIHDGVNAGDEGGAFWHLNGPVSLVNSRFKDCTTLSSFSTGGLMVHDTGTLTMTGCVTESCSAQNLGGGALRLMAAPLTVADCYFYNNRTPGLGGSIRSSDAPVSLSRTYFDTASAGQGGAGVYFSGGDLVAVDCAFTACAATNTGALGGAILTTSGGGTLTRCAFHQNSAAGRAGAVSLGNGRLTADQCSFTENSGGAVNLSGGATETSLLTNCFFHGNTDTALTVSGVQLSLVNCSFTANGQALSSAGGLVLSSTSPTLTNCLFAANIGILAVDYYGGTLSAGSSNNIFSPALARLTPVSTTGLLIPLPATVPPLGARSPAVTPVPLRYRAPLSGSAGLNAGTAAGAPTTDLTGITRPQHGGVDAGAIESTLLLSSTPPAGRVGSAYGPYQPVVEDSLAGGAPYVFSIAAGSSLPLGLTLDASTGNITGAPIAPGPVTFDLIVTSQDKRIGGGQQTITVGGSSLVQNPNDSGAGSLRQALADAAPGTSIDFAPAFLSTPRVITLLTPLSITKSVTILGPGADKLTIDTPASARGFDCTAPGISLSMDGMRIKARTEAAVYFESPGGSLTLRRCWVESVTPSSFATINVVNTTNVSVTESSFTGVTGTCLSISGTAVYTGQQVLLENTLFDGATVQAIRGSFYAGSLCLIRQCTISSSQYGLVAYNNTLEDIYQLENNVFKNTGGLAVYNDSGKIPLSLGGNVYGFGNARSGFGAGDIQILTEHLSEPGMYGGAMPTILPQMHSPAIDFATAGSAAFDQIGQPRPLRTAPDSGSREASPLVITNLPTLMPSQQVNEIFPSLALVAGGGTAPYTFTAVTLPVGLTLSSDGVLSGVPTVIGSQPIRIQVTDAAGFIGMAFSSFPAVPQALVTNGNDSGPGSLRDVLAGVVDNSIVKFASGVTTVTLGSNINTGTKNFTLDGGSGVTVRPAASANIVFLTVSPGTRCAIRNMSFEDNTTDAIISNGSAPVTVDGCSFTNCGGGITANSTTQALFITNSVFRQISTNSAVTCGVGSQLENCIFTKCLNTSVLFVKGSTTLTHCTLADNTGKAVLFTTEYITLRNCALYDNVGGLWSTGLVTAAASFNNILRGSGSQVLTHGVNGNIILPTASQAPLGPLFNYGGLRLSMPPLSSNSAALDAGTSVVGALATDGRGFTRPRGTAVDIGATEATATASLATPLLAGQRFQAYPAQVLTPASFNFSGSNSSAATAITLLSGLPGGMTWTPATGTLAGTPTVSGSFNLIFAVNSDSEGTAVVVPLRINPQTIVLNGNDSGFGSLRDVLTNSEDDNNITFDPAVTEVVLTGAEMSTGRRLTINGGLGGTTIRRASGTARWLNVTAGGNVSLRALTLRNFPTSGVDGSIVNAIDATLSLEQCLVKDAMPCAITGVRTVLTATNCTFSNITDGASGVNGAVNLVSTLPTPARFINCTFRDCDAAIRDEVQQNILVNCVVANCGAVPFNFGASGSAASSVVSPLCRNNLVEATGATSGLVSGQNGNIIGIIGTAKLLGLGDNGGPAQTCRLATNSRGVDLADAGSAPGLDAANLTRTGPGPDAGALETRLGINGFIPTVAIGQALPPSAFTATGGVSPYVWSATGLPAGFSINASTGIVSGTATTASTPAAVITAVDANGVAASWQDIVRVTTSAAPVGEIFITGNGREMPLRNNLAGEANGTHFGEVAVAGGSVFHTFIIKNIGNASLSVSLVGFDSGDTTSFSIIGSPIGSLPSGASFTLRVKFAPTAPGLREAVLRVNSNDSDEPTTYLQLAGIGTAPDLAVSGLGQSIASGDASPSAADGTLLGSAAVSGSSLTQDFVVTASGQGSLHLTDVSFTGAQAGDFSATWPASLASGSAGIVRVTFRPTALGTRTATLNLTTDAISVQPYSFAIQGSGIASPAVILGNGVIILDGDTTPATSDHTDFGPVAAGNVVQRTFTIANQLATPLTLSPVSLSGTGAAQYRIVTPPSGTVAGNDTTSFTVEYQRFGAGPAPATLSLVINGDASDPYDFAITASGAGAAAPTDLLLSASTLVENNLPGATVGTLTAVDSDEGDSFVFSLTSGAGSTDNAAFSLVGNELRLTAAADFETKSSYALRVRVTDAGGLFFEKAFTVAITNLNEAPRFTPGGDRVHPLATTGAISVPGWASGIQNGDAPAVQALNFTTTLISGAGIFTTPPALAANGDLTYTLNGTAGQAVVEVILTDDASIDGTVRSSAPVRFTIALETAATWLVTINSTTFSINSPGTTNETLAATRTGDILTLSSSLTTATFSLNGGAKTTGKFDLDLTLLPTTLTTFTVDTGAGTSDVLQWDAALEFASPVAITFTAETQTFYASARLTTPGAGSITLLADTMQVDLSSRFKAGTAISLRQQTTTRDIRLGDKSDATLLSFQPWELNGFTTPLLNIGQATGGNISITAPIAPAGAGTIKLLCSSTTSIDAPATGIDLTGNLALNGRLRIILSSAVPETGYATLRVAGTVNLTGTSFLTSGAYVPNPPDSFLLVDNDGTDPVIGTFTGLAEGATLTHAGRTMRISYVGGTGNDVTLTVQGPEIAITGNGMDIVHNDTSPSLTDHRDFGNVFLGFSLTRTFTVSNPGNATLNITSQVLSDTGAADYTILTPLPASLAAGASAPLVIRFTPSVTGVRPATCAIASNDQSEPSFRLNLTATGASPPALAAGDVAFTGINGVGNFFTFMPLVDIPAFSIIHFTDLGWKTGAAFSTATTDDGRATWTNLTVIPRGTHLKMTLSTTGRALVNLTTGEDLTSQVVFTGWTTAGTAQLGGTAGDSLIIYQGLATNPFFITALNNSGATVLANGWNNIDTPAETTSRLPSGGQNSLNDAVNAIGLAGGVSQRDNSRYNGPVTPADRATWLTRLLTRANWTGDNTGAAAGTIGLAATVGAGEINVTGSGAFGNAAITSGTVQRNFTIENTTGTGYLLLGTATITGVHAADFTIATSPLTAVAAGSSTTLSVTFNPSALGARTATLTIPSNDSDEANTVISLTGTGIIDPAPAKVVSVSLTPDGRLQVTFTTQADSVYQVQTSTTLAPGSWTNVATINGTGSLETWTNPNNAGPRQFVRIAGP